MSKLITITIEAPELRNAAPIYRSVAVDEDTNQLPEGIQEVLQEMTDAVFSEYNNQFEICDRCNGTKKWPEADGPDDSKMVKCDCIER